MGPFPSLVQLAGLPLYCCLLFGKTIVLTLVANSTINNHDKKSLIILLIEGVRRPYAGSPRRCGYGGTLKSEPNVPMLVQADFQP
ncbi:hypothetical protein BDZ45DRAFT_673507 [Acephala macrosclerotiorum]|nr:hypothetical protein BDZ45DRAFT_673507 [Acephala macrosclerotiorum]